MKQGLVLVDIQKDYFKGGKHELFEAEKAAREAEKVLTYFRRKNLPVFYVQHINNKKNATFFTPHSSGVEIFEGIAPQENETIITKYYPDSFFETDLKEQLEKQGVTELVVCGMMTHMCIDTTVRAAVSHGYTVTLIEDACTTRDLEWEGEVLSAQYVHKVFMASLNGIFAKVIKTSEWLKEM